jgi:tetratricopeptide (TPR) repeat protein
MIWEKNMSEKISKKSLYKKPGFWTVLIIVTGILTVYFCRKENGPENTEEYIKASEALKKGDIKQSEERFKKLCKEFPENHKLVKKLADIYFTEKKYNKALACYKKLFNDENFKSDSFLKAGIICRETGDIKNAEKFLDKSLEFKENKFRANKELGMIALSESDYKNSLKYFGTALNADSNDAESFYLIGLTLMRMKYYDSAVNSFQRALVINPDFEPAKIMLESAVKLQGTGKNDSIRQLENILKKNPDNAQVHNKLGLLYIKKGMVKKAEFHYSRALEIEPDMPGAVANMANLQVILKNYDKAETMYRKAIKLDPGNPVLYNNMGSMFAYRKMLPEAAECYRKALNIKPDYYEAEKNLKTAEKNMKKD